MSDPYVLVGLSSNCCLLLEGDVLSMTLGVATHAAEQVRGQPWLGVVGRPAVAVAAAAVP